jgi:hypothetical protein
MGAARLPPEEPPTQDGRYVDTCLAVLDILSRGQLHVSLDASREDVTVPQRFRGNHHLVLKFSWARYSPGNAVSGLEVDAAGFRGTFSFAQVGAWVDVPWAAVYAAEGGGRQVTWHERIPLKVRGAIASGALEKPPQAHRRPSAQPPAQPPTKTAGLVSLPYTEDQLPTVERTVPSGVLRMVPDEPARVEAMDNWTSDTE